MNLGKYFRDSGGLKANIFVFTFTLVGYALGLASLFYANLWLNAFGVLLTAQTLVISAYLLHEFSHHSIFKSPALNQKWGTLMMWINGSCFATFKEIRNKHMRHHVDRADVISFDFRAFFARLPASLKAIITFCEWAYIPAAEIMMHSMVIVLPFTTPSHAHKRKRVLLILLIRAAVFGAIAYVSIKALLLYMLAYGIMLTMLRFTDAYQHTYDAFVLQDSGKKGEALPMDGKLRDAVYEQANTYSNLTSIQTPWLNLFFLNFAYHNAHHEKPIAAWYQLPALHEKLYGKPSNNQPVVPMLQLLKSYRKHRLTRLTSDDYGVLEYKPGGAEGFIGAVGVSFLTAV